VTFDEIFASIKRAHAALPPLKVKRGGKGVNSAFDIPYTPMPSDPATVAEKCQQIKSVVDNQGRVSEPLWYAALGVLHFCTDGDSYAQEISKGHAGYSHDETNAKLDQLSKFGPTRCSTFADRNEGGCVGCPYQDKVGSPIQLGVTLDAIKAVPKVEIENFVEAPTPFKRTVEGVMGSKDDAALLVYPYDLYVEGIAYDQQRGCEVAVIHHTLPKSGDMVFHMRSSDVSDLRTFSRAMIDNHVGSKNPEMLRQYVSAYMDEHRRVRAIGMHDALSKTIVSEGELEPWSEASAIFGVAGMQAHAFVFGCVFGSPLMKFTSLEGCLFNAIGDTGSGKTLTARFALSAMGKWKGLELIQGDTEKSKITHIGAMGDRMTYVDEVTNAEDKAISAFVYGVTAGRSVKRLKETGETRGTASWHSITLTSSNSSLVEKLSTLKSNPDAEMARVFEINIEPQAALTVDACNRLGDAMEKHYGNAYAKYIEYVNANAEKCRLLVEVMIERLRLHAQAPQHERYLLASAACVLVGLQIAKSLDIIRFDVRTVAQWTIAYIIEQRTEIASSRRTPMDMLGEYLNEHTNYSVTVRQQTQINRNIEQVAYKVDKPPQGAIFIRWDTTLQKLWVDRTHIKHWLIKKQERMNKLRKAWLELGVLQGVERKCLGAGTEYTSSQVWCFEFDTAHPSMGHRIMQLVAESVRRLG
jgi:Domain of unknown function (DUF927)